MGSRTEDARVYCATVVQKMTAKSVDAGVSWLRHYETSMFRAVLGGFCLDLGDAPLPI
jgi:hypothetical protein